VLEIPCDAELAARASGAGLGVLCARAVLDFERFQYEWDRSLEERVGPFEIVAPLPWVKTSHAHTRTYKIGDVPLAVQFFDQDQIVVLTYPGTKMWEAGQRSVSALIQAANRSEKTARVQEPEGALAQEGPPYLAGVGDVSNPRLIQGSKVAPAYPEQARKEHHEASVFLQALVLEDGTIDELVVKKCTAPGMGFEEAAMQAVRQWRYEPAVLEGRALDVYFTIVVSFALQ